MRAARANRSDANQKAIVDALRAAGCAVRHWGRDGAPDLVVSRSGRVWLIEVKTRLGRLTEAQERFKAEGWPVMVARTPLQALTCVGLIQEGQ